MAERINCLRGERKGGKGEEECLRLRGCGKGKIHTQINRKVEIGA